MKNRSRVTIITNVVRHSGADRKTSHNDGVFRSLKKAKNRTISGLDDFHIELLRYGEFILKVCSLEIFNVFHILISHRMTNRFCN